jgi:hypothetical protein
VPPYIKTGGRPFGIQLPRLQQQFIPDELVDGDLECDEAHPGLAQGFATVFGYVLHPYLLVALSN